MAPHGSIWIIDTNLSVLMHLTAEGLLSDVATGMYGPEGVTVAPDGTVYIADRGGYRIVTPNGNGGVSKVAGDLYNAGFTGDGGPAKRAHLWLPYDVATSGNGDLYIADSANQRIRVIDADSGMIDTIVGTGVPGFAGDGGPAIDAQIYGPQAIAVDQAGTFLLIADTTNGRLRRVDLASGIITTVAGTGSGAVSFNPLLTAAQTPLTRIAALCLDSQGNAYFPVFWGDLGTMIMRMDPSGQLTPVAGGGRSTEAGVPPLDFALPDILGLAINPFDGALLIAGSDSKVYRIPLVAPPAT